MSRVLRWRIPEQWAGRTVQDYLRRGLGFSSSVVIELKHSPGGLLKNGEACRSVDLLQENDLLTLTFPKEPMEYPPAPGELSVLWEDEDFLVVHKPPAMPVHPSPGHDRDSLLNRVAYHYQSTGQSHRVRPLYRLDRDTSGVLVLAKHRAAAGAGTEKRYLALCQGELTGEGTIDQPIGLGPESKIRRVTGTGQRAVTHWRALAQGGGHTLLCLSLETGRTHQIRCHMAGIGHPLAGDDLYGGSREWVPRQALHCAAVRLTCPALAMDRTFTSPLPRDLTSPFPWLPSWEELCKEDILCLPV